ncbi:MAG: chorismate mutase [Rhodothermales bacterium]|nr:chorismate mutase [Rhodothermales bacterium]
MLIKTALKLVNSISDKRPQVSDDPSVADLDAWRNRIDAIDVAVMNLLNERSVCANKIGLIKKHNGMPVYVPSRETEVIANVVSSNPGPLPDQAVRRLFERIIDETRSLERHLYQEEPLSGEGDPHDD